MKKAEQHPPSSAFPDPNDPNISLFDVSGRPITSFRGLGAFATLKYLIIDHTQVSTFEGAPVLPSLISFSCKGTPLALQKHLHIMSVMAFGESLRTVNSVKVDSTIHLLGCAYFAYRNYLLDGYLVVEMTPLKLMHTKTRKRKTIYVDGDSPPPEASAAAPVAAPQESRVVARPRKRTAPPAQVADALKNQFDAITKRLFQQPQQQQTNPRPSSAPTKKKARKGARHRTLALPEPPIPQPIKHAPRCEKPPERHRVHPVEEEPKSIRHRRRKGAAQKKSEPRTFVQVPENLSDNDYNISGEQSSMELLPTLSPISFPRAAQRSLFSDSYSDDDVIIVPNPPRTVIRPLGQPTGDYYESSDYDPPPKQVDNDSYYTD